MEFGTDKFEIVFKAKQTKNNVDFSIDGAKFREVNATTSYTGNQITGIETTVTTKVEEKETTNTENNIVSNEQVSNTVNNTISNEQVNNTIKNNITNSGTNTNDKTVSTGNTLPETGENDKIIKLLILSILLIIVNKIRVDRLKDVK